ncbi:ABC transporter permease [Ruania albidiflava]|uniref:ABC transporter permease n=1 Tax=Ruania albidiflava TaxID=366586 RepID=UPI0003B5930F|nr:ABC transporter permease [Ruania albidiflava]
MTVLSPLSRGTGALVRNETRLFLRDGGSLFFALVFPAVLLIGVGLAIPGMDERIPAGAGAGLPMIAFMIPPVLAAAVATPSLSTVPATIAAYREQGVLTRLSTTPMRPAGVLVAQLVVGVAAFLVATVLALAVGALVFTIPVPQQPLLVVVAVLLGAVAMFSVGMIIAARATKAATAQGVGMLVYFPMLFFAGLWTPGPVMPDAVAAVATWTPLGAASQAISAGWLGGGTPWLQLAVLVGYTVIGIAISARVFRWS